MLYVISSIIPVCVNFSGDQTSTNVPVDRTYLTISLATAIGVIIALVGFTWRASRAVYAAERTSHHVSNLIMKFESLKEMVQQQGKDIAVISAEVQSLKTRIQNLECDEPNGSSNRKRT